MSATSISTQSESVAPGKIWRVGLLALVAATAANLIIYAVGAALFGVGEGFDMFQPPAIIASTLVGVAAATIVFWIINRFARRPIPIFRIVGAVALVLSLGGPLQVAVGMMPGVQASGDTVASMLLMHIVTAVIAVGMLTTLTRDK